MSKDEQSKSKTELAPLPSAALSRGGVASLASRGMQDLLAREESAEQWVKRGKELADKHQYQEAIWCFERGIQLDPNHADLQYCLGVAYYRGDGVPKNYTQAGIWWRKAADQGHAFAEYNLGVAYDTGDCVPLDHAQAGIWWRKAAEHGSEDARLALARQWYARGSDLWNQESYEEAFECWERGIELSPNHSGLQYALGYAYATGLGVTEDFSEAVAWCYKSAEQGFADACFVLGWCYENGRGVELDDDEAMKWYRLAAKQGDERSKQALYSLVGKLQWPE